LLLGVGKRFFSLQRATVMTAKLDKGWEERQAEAAKVKQKEGYGAVPNPVPGQPASDVEKLKEAMHQVEEEKGDWAKDH
jgi:hypothetical protein